MENVQNELTTEIIGETETSENHSNHLKLIKPRSKNKARSSKSPNGVCTVINSKKNGKRVTWAKETMDCLGNPESIEIGFTEVEIVIAKKLPENGVEFNLRKSGNKGVIYSSGLVEEITELFDLDFTGRVSITFTEAEEYTDDSGYSVVKIKVK